VTQFIPFLTGCLCQDGKKWIIWAILRWSKISHLPNSGKFVTYIITKNTFYCFKPYDTMISCMGDDTVMVTFSTSLANGLIDIHIHVVTCCCHRQTLASYEHAIDETGPDQDKLSG
jgi:hypothetical protein